MASSVALFVLAGLAEIGDGYLVWLWLREGRPLWVGQIGAAVLVLYGVLPTLQPPGFDFGRVYAAYGGLFVALSLLWAGSWTAGGRARRSSPTGRAERGIETGSGARAEPRSNRKEAAGWNASPTPPSAPRPRPSAGP